MYDVPKRDLPCVNCITLPICKQTGKCTNGVSTLAMKCYILDRFLTKDKEWNVVYMYQAYLYFDRGHTT
jgi:hypothetical protein